MIAAKRKNRCVPEASIFIYRDVCCSSAYINERGAEVFLVFRKHCRCRGNGLKHNINDINACPLTALKKILHRRHSACNYMNFYLKPDPCHANRVFYPILSVKYKFSRDYVKNLSVKRNIYHACRIYGALNILRLYFFPFYADSPITLKTLYMPSGNPDINRLYLNACHCLGIFHRLLY